MTLTSAIVKNITYPIWMLRDGKIGIYSYIKRYRNYDQSSAEQLHADQLESLKKIIKYSYENTKYYKIIFDKIGFSPSDLKSIDDMVQLPVITKEEIRENLEDMVSTKFNISDLAKDSTGGSTGVPMVFYRDKECWEKRRAQELFFDRWVGYEIGRKTAYFVSGSHQPKGIASSIKARIRNATCERIIAFDPYNVTDEYMGKFLEEFRRFKPEIIKCFPNSLYLFADYLQRKNITDLKVNAISCTGENLYPSQRKLFEDTFKCRVFEKYGTREAGVIACECSMHDGMHVFEAGVVMELVRDGRKARHGEVAEIVITGLFNYGMPLIRYKIGDLAVSSGRTCGCGSKLMLIDKVLGRDRDILIAEDGTPKAGYLFVEAVNKNNIPARCQFVQEDRATLSVNIVKLNGYNGSYETIIKENCFKILGKSINIKISYIDDIPRESSGKFKYVTSKVSPFSKNV